MTSSQQRKTSLRFLGHMLFAWMLTLQSQAIAQTNSTAGVTAA